LDLLDLFNLIENGRIGSERNEPRMIRMTGIVGLLNPLYGRLDAGGETLCETSRRYTTDIHDPDR
jgi:hypothetical protein